MRLLDDVSGYTCAQCGELRVNTESGSVCPRGHGRKCRKVPGRIARRWKQWVAIRNLPDTEFLGGHRYLLDGVEYLKSSEELCEVRARWRDRPLRLKRRVRGN